MSYIDETPTSEMTVEEITYARAADKLRVDANGLGWVDKAWLRAHRAATGAPRREPTPPEDDTARAAREFVEEHRRCDSTRREIDDLATLLRAAERRGYERACDDAKREVYETLPAKWDDLMADRLRTLRERP